MPWTSVVQGYEAVEALNPTFSAKRALLGLSQRVSIPLNPSTLSEDLLVQEDLKSSSNPALSICVPWTFLKRPKDPLLVGTSLYFEPGRKAVEFG
jgi:hypothetical protein